jgi:sugar lactone lactonase YvrE
MEPCISSPKNWSLDSAAFASVFTNSLLWLTAVLYLGIAPACTAATLAPGDIVVLDIGVGGEGGPEILFRVDPVSGARSVFKRLRELDAEDRLLETNGLAVERTGNVLVTDSRLGPDNVPALYRLDVKSRARTLVTVFDFVSSDGKRKAARTVDVTTEDSGSILVLVGTVVQRPPPVGLEEGPPILYRVSPKDGKPTILTDFAQVDPRPIGGWAVAVEPSGNLLVVAGDSVSDPMPQHVHALYRVDPEDGKAALFVAVPPEPNGGLNNLLNAIEVTSSGTILAVAPSAGAGNGRGILYRIDPAAGAFHVLTDFSQGPLATQGFAPVDVAMDASGRILVADMETSPTSDNHLGSVWQVDPLTGARSILSDFGKGANKGLNPLRIAVVPAAKSPFVEFAKFNPVLNIDMRPALNADRFNLKAAFVLDGKSGGIRPDKEPVSLGIGPYSITLPNGSFRRHGRHAFRFKGKINGVRLRIGIVGKGCCYIIRAKGCNAEFGKLGGPIPISLGIGDDRGRKDKSVTRAHLFLKPLMDL